MYSTSNTKNALMLFLVVIVLLGFSGFLFLVDQTNPTGNLVARGGDISNLSINQSASTTSWSVLYGVFDEFTGVSSQTVSPNTILRTNFTSYGYDSSMVVVAYANNFDESNISQAPRALIDAYLGVASIHPESGTNTFSELYNISIGNKTFELYGTQTISLNGSFITSAVISNGNLAFVTTSSNGTGFDNTSTFFQFMLPVNVLETYSFEVISNVTCPNNFEIEGVLDLDNVSINLNWSSIPGALKYRLYSVDSMNSSKYIEFYENSSINISTTTFTEIPSSNERYYRVEAILPAYTCYSNNTVGMLMLPLTPDANLVSFPFIFVNNSVEEILRPILSSFNSLNGYNNSDQSYNFYIQFMGVMFHNFNDISMGMGYWLGVNETVNLTIVGSVSNELLEPVYNRSNLVGFPLIEGNNTVPHVLRSINGNYSTVNEYNNSAKSYNFYIIFGGSVFSNFDTIKPLSAYWIFVNESETISLP